MIGPTASSSALRPAGDPTIRKAPDCRRSSPRPGASRRGAEELIAAGRVSVDGVVVTEQGMRVDPRQVIVRVDGVRVLVDEDMTYLALNKPTGYHSTMADDQGRPCVGDLVAERVMAGQRLFPSGARRRHRGPAVVDQRRGARPPVDAPVVRGSQDLSGHRARRGAAFAVAPGARRRRPR